MLTTIEPARTQDAAPPRELVEFPGGAPNAHKYWYRMRSPQAPLRSFARILLNYCAIYACRHCPSLTFKRWVFRALGMKLAENVTIASGVVIDYFRPELVEIGENTIIGMDSLLLTHEFLHDRFRIGAVRIGKNVLVGARTTILAGVTVGDGCTISAQSFVHRSVPPNMFVVGNPAVIREKSRP